MPESRILIYLLRRDLRVSDNPILHNISTKQDHGFTHLLPLYVFPAQQVEVSGFIPKESSTESPYPQARSATGSFWRCGPHRTKFVAEAVWDVKEALQALGSDLCIRVGMTGEVVQEMVRRINECNGATVSAVWMVGECTTEEKQDEQEVKAACAEADVQFKIWQDEKYLIDDRDLPFKDATDLPDVFTTYRKQVEPLRERPHPVLDAPKESSLPPYPPENIIPAQHSPFTIPTSLDGIQKCLWAPLQDLMMKDPPSYPKGTKSAHPFIGGETTAHQRLTYLLSSGCMTAYKDTRNGLLGTDFSSKLSAWLAFGCITARQIHASMLAFEDGVSSHPESSKWSSAPGYGKGENPGTQAMRFELLWRDYMRLCARKFGPKLFTLGGFRDEPEERWSRQTAGKDGIAPDIPQQAQIERFLNGTTGMSLIDASQRELYHTGYTSNRARQNVASFFAKKLNIDWRVGAEWYECMLVDYDVSSNWGNWQYVAGVGNDPRGEARIFNPVKQAFDYDPEGAYVKAWVPELRGEGLEPRELFQPWTVGSDRRRALGLHRLPMVDKPLVRIDFHIGKKGKGTSGRGGGGGGGGRGGHASGVPTHQQQQQHQGNSANSYGYVQRAGRNALNNGGYGGRGYGSTRGHLQRGGWQPRWYGRQAYAGHNYGPGGAGREPRTVMMDKEREMSQGQGQGQDLKI